MQHFIPSIYIFYDGFYKEFHKGGMKEITTCAGGRTKYYVTKEGTVLSTNDPSSDPATWRRMATYNGKGYRRVRLQGKTYKIHRLVAEAFVPNPAGLPNVLHIDGDRSNNHYTNLEWSNRQSNQRIRSVHSIL